jgi:DNA-binding SARP family transcriptional activator
VSQPNPSDMEFCLLGSLLVRSASGAVAPRGKQGVVLAALLLNADRVVSVDELIEVAWGGSPPPSARVSVQNHVMRLRKTLGDAGSRVSTQAPGYRTRVEAGEVDVCRFKAHLGAARSAARGCAWDVAAAEARAGLALWRGA